MNIVCLDSTPELVILFKCCTELNGAVVLNICTAAFFFSVYKNWPVSLYISSAYKMAFRNNTMHQVECQVTYLIN